jgi:hypothetical protein
MRCVADRLRPGWAVRAGACAVAAGCLLAACSSPARPGSGSQGGPSAASNAIKAARRALSLNGGGGPGGGQVFVVGGPGGGFVALPAGGGSGGGGRPRISLGPIPPADSSQVVNLPLGTYADVAFSQQTVLSEAQTLLTQKCMTGRGFVYSIQATPSQAQTLVQSAEYPFGVTSEADAATYGYGQPGSSGPRAGPAFLGGFQTFGDLARQARAWTVALLGFAPGARIGPRQAQGCLSEASSELYGSRGGLSDPVPGIAIEAARWTESDPRVEAVDSAWSQCMAAHGYHYNTPQDAADRGWPSKPTPAETATAEADVSCKQAVNLDNTWLAVEAAYQSALIGQDLSTLAGLQHSFQSMLHRAEALLSLSSLPAEPLNLPGRPGQVILGPTPVLVRPAG